MLVVYPFANDSRQPSASWKSGFVAICHTYRDLLLVWSIVWSMRLSETKLGERDWKVCINAPYSYTDLRDAHLQKIWRLWSAMPANRMSRQTSCPRGFVIRGLRQRKVNWSVVTYYRHEPTVPGSTHSYTHTHTSVHATVLVHPAPVCLRASIPIG